MNFNVALFTDSDVFAGTERHILDLALGLRAQGDNICVLCPEPSPLAERLYSLGVHVVAVAKHGILDWRAIARLKEVVSCGAVDIIHAHNGRTALQAALAVRLAGQGRLIVTQHFLQPNRTVRTGPRRIMSNLIHDWVVRQIEQAIAISTAVRDQMLARRDCPADRITTVLNGIADPRAQLLRTPGEVRRELALASDALLLVCAARLEAEKGLRTLIEAMDRVTCETPVMCAIAGTGSQRDEMQRVIDSTGTTRVRLLGFRDDVLSLINAADIFVLPSPAEPFGLSIVEAMALGKPVIACATGGPLEIVQPEITGLLVPPSNPATMSAAVERLLKSEELRRRFGKNGRSRYLEYFTAARMAREISRVYERALAPAANTPGLTATGTVSI